MWQHSSAGAKSARAPHVSAVVNLIGWFLRARFLSFVTPQTKAFSWKTKITRFRRVFARREKRRDNSRLRRFHFKTRRKEEKELKRYCAFLFFLFFCLLFLFLLLLLFFQTYFYEGVSAKITLEEKKRCSPSGSDHVFSRFSRFAQTF